jgi:hypothetical protein
LASNGDDESSSLSGEESHSDNPMVAGSELFSRGTERPPSDHESSCDRCDPPISLLIPNGLAVSSGVDFGNDSTLPIGRRTFDFSDGIAYPSVEATIDSRDLAHAVTRNKKGPSALHDLILFSKEGPIPVQVKASIEKQLRVYRPNPGLPPPERVDLLIWVSLCDVAEMRRRRLESVDNIIFLNGSGVCNGMSLDMLRAAKMVKMSDGDYD